MWNGSQGVHSRRGHSAICQIVGNLVVVPHEGSIDLSAPALRPCGLCPCRSLPSGSIPAGDILRYARSWVPYWWFHTKVRLISALQRFGPAGFVHVARFPAVPFPPLPSF